MTTELEQAYQYCEALARHHYENFPVISVLQPRHLRRDIAAIYAFARTADDIADEGELSATERLAALADYEQQINYFSQSDFESSSPIFTALRDVVLRHQLPTSLLLALLSAFKQDVVQTQYEDDAELHDYCRRSANPIGRLLLLLHQYHDDEVMQHSDAICTALQLINFYQDIADDHISRRRLYIPTSSLTQAGISEFTPNAANSRKIATILREKYLFSASLLEQGQALGQHLSGRFGWQIRMTLLTALTVLLALSKQDDKHLFSRPRLGKSQFLLAALLSISKRSFHWQVKQYIKQIRLLNQATR